MPQKIEFDFTGDGGLEALGRLEDILSAGHWSDHGLDLEAETTALLIRLLGLNGVAVYKKAYEAKSAAEYTAEILSRARLYGSILKKRDDGLSLLPIAALFGDDEPDMSKTEYGALFYPSRRAYVRTGGLPPDRLLDLLAREGCGAVLLFPPYEENTFYAFVRNMTRDELSEMLEVIRENQQNALFDAVREANEKIGMEFPRMYDETE